MDKKKENTWRVTMSFKNSTRCCVYCGKSLKDSVHSIYLGNSIDQSSQELCSVYCLYKFSKDLGKRELLDYKLSCRNLLQELGYKPR